MLNVLPFNGVHTLIGDNKRGSGKPSLKPLQFDSVSFGYDSPLKDVARHCAYCGTEMLTEKEVEQTIGRLLNYSGEKLQPELKKIIRMLSASPSNVHRKEIMEELLHSSEADSSLTGKQLIENILRSREIAFEDELEASKKAKTKLFSDLRRMQSSLPEFTQKQIDALIELNPALEITILKGIDLIRKKSERQGEKLTPAFRTYCKNAQLRYIELKKDKTLRVALNSTAQGLLQRIIDPLKITMEHIHPHSKKGKDHTYNYLPVCSHCNSERSNIDFVEQLQAKPQIEGFITRSLREVQRAISRLINPPGELTNYIEEVKNTLHIESQGQLNIVV